MCIFKNLFGKKKETSAETAKNRINLQIHYDRAGVNPELLENIKRDIIIAVSKHIEYDPSEVEARFTREGANKSVLHATIPIARIKRNETPADRGKNKRR
ncbi:MAG: cell division topological specificity factor MinE [Bacillota bacterium]|nr:cell division topological specificity factor MinE [Bacillota bacterium]